MTSKRYWLILILMLLINRAQAQHSTVYYPKLLTENTNLEALKLEALKLLQKGNFLGDLKTDKGHDKVKYTFELDSLNVKAKGFAIVIPLKYQILVFKNPDKYLVQFKNRVNFGIFDELESAKQLADVLYTIQNILYKKSNEEIIKKIESERVKFDSLVQKYRSMEVKPLMTEEQRKLIVQANYFTQHKQFQKALDAYNKALEINPIAYPAAYSNMALIEAQLSNFLPAIEYMKKYLLLEPDAPDARASQDKIYEWEVML